MEKDIAVYSFRVAQRLLRDGYRLVNMELNSKIRGKIVFYFENTESAKTLLSKRYGIRIE